MNGLKLCLFLIGVLLDRFYIAKAIGVVKYGAVAIPYAPVLRRRIATEGRKILGFP